MAEPGDPEKPDDDAADREAIPSNRPAPAAPAWHDQDLDDLIGFTSPSALAGRERPAAFDAPPAEPDPAPEAILEPEVERQPEPIIAPDEPVFVRPPEPAPPLVTSMTEPEPEPDLFELRPRQASTGSLSEPPPPQPAAGVADPLPAWAIETPAPASLGSGRKTFGRAETPAEPAEGAMGLYTIYALILFAVPTLGVSALIALFAVAGRSKPHQALALSHHVYQKRTLWISAIAALLGVVLIAVNLGVFVLFLLAVWVIVRGTAGILALSANREIKSPRAWLI